MPRAGLNYAQFVPAPTLVCAFQPTSTSCCGEAGYPLQWTEQLEFEGDRHLTPDALAKDALRGDFNPIQPLRRAGDDALHCNQDSTAARDNLSLAGRFIRFASGGHLDPKQMQCLLR